MDAPASQVTKTHQEYLALVKEICAQRPDAYRWFEQVLETALIWDHIIDGDDVDKARVDFVFSVITTEWVLNDFFVTNRSSLVPILTNCISSWKHSNTVPGGDIKAYDLYTELPCAICLILQGGAGVGTYIPRIRALIERERREDARRDTPPFLIVGLPRSRTAWLAAFLTDGDVFCHHELLRSCDNPDQFVGRLLATPANVIGDSDPSIPIYYSQMKGQLPPHKVVFINRPSDECRDSLKSVLVGLGIDPAPHMGIWGELEDNLAKMKNECPDAMTFNFHDLNNIETMRALSEYCTGLPFNEARWKMFDEMNVTAIPEKVIENQRLIK